MLWIDVDGPRFELLDRLALSYSSFRRPSAGARVLPAKDLVDFRSGPEGMPWLSQVLSRYSTDRHLPCHALGAGHNKAGNVLGSPDAAGSVIPCLRVWRAHVANHLTAERARLGR